MTKSKKAVVKAPAVRECERLLKITESGHNRMISDFIEDLIGLINALGAEQDRLYIADVNVCDLLEKMGGDWDGKVIAKFWGWLVKKHEDPDADADDGYFPKGRACVFDIRIQDVLHEYFKIDTVKLENERRELLAGCRANNALHDARKDLGLEG